MLENSVVFARLMEEHGKLQSEQEQGDQLLDGSKSQRKNHKNPKLDDEAVPKKADPALMQLEERNTGSVTWSTYRKCLRFARSVAWAPLLFLLLTFSLVAQGMSDRNLFGTEAVSYPDLVGNNSFLGIWTSSNIPGLTQGGYMGIYASLGED